MLYHVSLLFGGAKSSGFNHNPLTGGCWYDLANFAARGFHFDGPTAAECVLFLFDASDPDNPKQAP